MDRRAEWFPLRPGGRTVIGRRPRAATEDTLYIFLCHGLSTTSLDRGWHLELLGMALGLRVAQAFILLSLSLHASAA